MFEDMTYESIMADMLNRVVSDVDKREGSIIYDALAPCAYQLAQSYFQLDNYINLFFAKTAVGEFLDYKVADYGLSRKSSTYAVRQVETTAAVNLGTRWGLNDTSYVITELISTNIYKASCEQLGTIGNIYNGTLENIDNVSGVVATLTNIITSGIDEETDDNLRGRLISFLQNPATSGNKNHYLEWAKEVEGIGYAKVYPRWNGVNTVKLTILTEDKTAVSVSKVQEVADYIEERRPPGADVTVQSAIEKPIDIIVKITLSANSTIELALADIEKNLKQYFHDLTFVENVVRYTKIGEAILNSNNIIDYENLTINNLIANIQMNDDEIPVLGAIKLI